ncbi:MAG: protein sip-5 [Luteimonas sp.]
MNFEGLKNRVERAESLVDGRAVQTTDRYRALRTSWREAWTPPRILIAGLVMGFATGHLEPRRALTRLGKLGGPKSIQLISALSGLLTSVQAAVAAATAEKAAETADDAAQTADAAADNVAARTDGTVDTQAAAAAGAAAAVQVASADATQTQSATQPGTTPDVDTSLPRTDRGRPDPVLSEQPRPAEAATELSESGR